MGPSVMVEETGERGKLPKPVETKPGERLRDDRREGFAVFLLKDAIGAMNVEPEDVARAKAEMDQPGAKPNEIGEVF